MDLIRIGDKLISMEKIIESIEEMLKLRQQGLSQAEVAKKFDTDRTFISRLENLGEVRKGKTIALVGFPIKNIDEIRDMAVQEGVDYVLLMTDKERWDFVYEKTGIELLNEVMGLIYKVRQYDVVIIIGSDQRLRLFKALLDKEVVSISIGKSPITQDKYIDPDSLREVIRKLKKGDD
ncbi:helix-turn-helix domain-containing protein [Biomaibacter acetigenes]|uniref:Helix-turn-helix domain-containing protein n=1 Tax=Biomaibacter acetigenes TaxID=2316383 RepID=A0A3G2R8X2_9FIRM|nr:helix-turn-helix domain-containing protein [Biomaibacter acetigenes]AYO31863.1 helix-turn-helix domain-containing protein [Biomaibacter acetigenes]RKL62403.1 helix-turn-helix domain-containing protein [Thermoanaerobacteraceae bacterium SP2]